MAGADGGWRGDGLRRAIAAALFALGLALAYAPLLSAGFLGEDLETLVRAQGWSAAEPEAPALRRPLDEFTIRELVEVAEPHGSFLGGLSVALSLRVFGAGPDGPLGLPAPAWFRIENLLWLLLASYGLILFLRRLLTPWLGQEQTRVAATMSAAIFAVHPICVPSVAAVSGRADLLALALSTLCAATFLRGRQRREARTVVVAVALAAVAGCAGQLALALPPVLAVSEYTSARRHRPRAVRLRTALTTFVAFAGAVLINSGFISGTTGHGYYPQIVVSLTRPLDSGDLVRFLGFTFEKLGVLVLPANASTLGALGLVLAGLLFLVALQPAFLAARTAPRLWGRFLVAWIAALVLVQLFGVEERVLPASLAQGQPLLGATLVLCTGLGVASTAITGLRRLSLPIGVAFGYAVLAHGNAQPYVQGAVALDELRENLGAGVLAHGREARYVVVDTPRAELGLDAVGRGLRWVLHPIFLGADAPEAAAARPLAVDDLTAEAFVAWTREPEFEAVRRERAVVGLPVALYAPELVDGVPPVREVEYGWWRVEPPEAGSGPRSWTGAAGSPALDLDPFGIETFVVRGRTAGAAPPERALWRASDPRLSSGAVAGTWRALGDGVVEGVFDLGASPAFLLGGRVRRVWLDGALAEPGDARLLDELPGLGAGFGPTAHGSNWVFPAPPAESLAGLAPDRWRLELLDLAGLEHAELDARPRPDGTLLVPSAEAWVDLVLDRGGGPVAWQLDLLVDDVPARRASGRRAAP